MKKVTFTSLFLIIVTLGLAINGNFLRGISTKSSSSEEAGSIKEAGISHEQGSSYNTFNIDDSNKYKNRPEKQNTSQPASLKLTPSIERAKEELRLFLDESSQLSKSIQDFKNNVDKNISFEDHKEHIYELEEKLRRFNTEFFPKYAKYQRNLIEKSKQLRRKL